MSKKTSKQGQSPEKSSAQSSGASRPSQEPITHLGRKTKNEIFAIDLLERQHVELRNLFAQFNQGNSQMGRAELLEQVATLLRNHTSLEERHFYPGVLTKDTESLLKEARKEHRDAEERLGKLFQLDTDDDDFPKQFNKLVEAVQHHIQEEEDELFPKVAKEIPTATLSEIGQEMEKSYRLMSQVSPSVGDKVETFDRSDED